jgi:hypothetical protein
LLLERLVVTPERSIQAVGERQVRDIPGVGADISGEGLVGGKRLPRDKRDSTPQYTNETVEISGAPVGSFDQRVPVSRTPRTGTPVP